MNDERTHTKLALGVAGKDGEEALLAIRAEAGQAAALADALDDFLPELREAEFRDLREGQGPAVTDGGKEISVHSLPSTRVAALWIMEARGRGSHSPIVSESRRAITRGAVVAKVSL